MTPAKLQELAREAGITIATWGGVRCGVPELARFAALVRATALTEAVQVCEKVEPVGYFENDGGRYDDAAGTRQACVDALRVLAQQAGREEA